MAARAGQGAPPLKSFVEGRIPGLAFCATEPDLRAAFELFDEVGRVPHFVHNSRGPIGSLMNVSRPTPRALVTQGPDCAWPV